MLPFILQDLMLMLVALGSKAGATPLTKAPQIHPSKQVNLGMPRNLTKGNPG